MRCGMRWRREKLPQAAIKAISACMSRRRKCLLGKGKKLTDLTGTGQPSFSYAGINPAMRKGAVFMRVVVVKFPKALCGLMRKIFHMD